MRTLMTLASVLVVMALAFWAYRENYRTQAVLDEMQQTQREIAGLRERLATLNAEWAYLNRPERLSRLVELHSDKLELVPLTPGQLLRPNQIAYAQPKPPADSDTEDAEDASTAEDGGSEADAGTVARHPDAPKPRPFVAPERLP